MITKPVELSIVDFFNPPALSAQLFQVAADCGFARYWIGEHRTRYQCPSPLTLCAVLAGLRPDIRVGTAAVLLGEHEPRDVADQSRMLTHMYGDRLDLGVTRTRASGSDLVALLQFLRGEGDEALLDTEDVPQPWVMGATVQSAVLAGQLGCSFCTSFHHGVTRTLAREMLAAYRDAFTFTGFQADPRTSILVSGIAAADQATLAAALEGRTGNDVERFFSGLEYNRTVELAGIASDCVHELVELASDVESDEVAWLSLVWQPIEIESDTLCALGEAMRR